nr:584_t:CDS:2 [Entrophospora candida]
MPILTLIIEWNDKKNCIFSELSKIHGEIWMYTSYSLENSAIVETTPNVVMFKASPPANCDRNVFATCKLFKEDILSGYNKRLDLVADDITHSMKQWEYME